jgi:SAM-dependent methyltransferase
MITSMANIEWVYEMRRRHLIAALTGLLASEARAEPAKPRGAPDVIYVPTPQAAVDAMLALAKVGPGDVVYDLGSGDGRIPITAALRHGARAVGVEINPRLVREARAAAKAAGVAEKVRFRETDLFGMRFREATVVTLYLLPDLNLRLKPRLLADLPPGARIVSYSFDMGDWPPERTISLPEGDVFLWRVPAKN